MKKFFVLLFALFMSVPLCAQDQVEVDMENVDPTVNEGPRKSPAVLPRVFYGSRSLSVWTPYVVDMVQIVIRDEYDSVIYATFAVLSSGLTSFTLTSDVCAEKYSIELLYGDRHLIGYF